jgi:hypothetical protein
VELDVDQEFHCVAGWPGAHSIEMPKYSWISLISAFGRRLDGRRDFVTPRLSKFRFGKEAKHDFRAAFVCGMRPLPIGHSQALF